MNAPFWVATCFMSKDEAERFYHNSMPRQVASRCVERDDGFGCTLFHDHSGDHEAWGLGHILYHTWPNLRCPTSH